MPGIRIDEQFAYLRAKIREASAENPGAEQAIALQTASGNVHVILKSDPLDFEAETRYLEKMAQSGDTHVLCMLAMWKGSAEPDLASYNLRTGLVEMDARNMDTLMILRGTYAHHFRRLNNTMSEKFLKEFNSRQ